MGSSVDEGWVIQPPDSNGWSFHVGKDDGPQGYFANLLKGLAGVPAGIVSGIKNKVLAPSAAHVREAGTALSQGDLPMAALNALASIPGSDYGAQLSGKATEALMRLKQRDVSGAAGVAPQAIPGVQSGIAAQNNFVNRAEQQFAADPSTVVATNPLGELHGNLLGMALLGQADKIPPGSGPAALAALKEAASVRTRIFNPTVAEAAAAGTGAMIAGPGGAKVAYGLMKVPSVINAAKRGWDSSMAAQALAKQKTGLPDVTTEVPAEVPASSIEDLVSKATEPPPPPPKFTHQAARDAAIELYNQGVKQKDAPALLERSFDGAHPDAIKIIVKEEYKKLLNKATGKPVEPESTPAVKPPSPTEPPPASATEPTVSSPAVHGRRWQQENITSDMTPEQKQAALDAQTAKNFAEVKPSLEQLLKESLKAPKKGAEAVDAAYKQRINTIVEGSQKLVQRMKTDFGPDLKPRYTDADIIQTLSKTFKLSPVDAERIFNKIRMSEE